MKQQNNEVMKNQATKSINFSMLNLIPKAYPQSLALVLNYVLG